MTKTLKQAGGATSPSEGFFVVSEPVLSPVE